MTEANIIGRKQELKMLKEVWSSREAELLAIYGRRRVGKTHLIREFFSSKGTYFELTGQKDGSLHDQLDNFIKAFSQTFFQAIPLRTPSSWKEAFELVTAQINNIPKTQKLTIFFDELPWLATKRSKMLQAFDYFWNHYWSKNSKLVVVVCGSAASWMLEHLINAKGGLHNRLTRIILLKPFNLKDTQEFLRHRGISFQHKQILDLYMVFGGIPYYLKQIRKGKSPAQNINKICFQREGLLYGEFHRLFHSLFDAYNTNLSIVKAIAKSWSGISRIELIRITKILSGGSLDKRLEELETAGFIQSYIPYGQKKKGHYYRVIDEYTLFYLRWIEPMKDRGIEGGKSYWQTKSSTAQANAWSGYSFENICLKHIDQIQEALGIQSIATETGSWRFVPKKGSLESGAQIDLLFDRDDDIITLCEIKYSQKAYSLDKGYAKKLIQKIEAFEKQTSTNKQIFLALITISGLKKTIWSEELIHNVVTLNSLFTL